MARVISPGKNADNKKCLGINICRRCSYKSADFTWDFVTQARGREVIFFEN